jgi:hypothetical protein
LKIKWTVSTNRVTLPFEMKEMKVDVAIVFRWLHYVSLADGYDPAEVNQAAPLPRREFADALGCCKNHISLLWSEGMPNSSIAAAKAWRLDQKGNLFFLIIIIIINPPSDPDRKRAASAAAPAPVSAPRRRKQKEAKVDRRTMWRSNRSSDCY